jgi:hypothetical protein
MTPKTLSTTSSTVTKNSQENKQNSEMNTASIKRYNYDNNHID